MFEKKEKTDIEFEGREDSDPNGPNNIFIAGWEEEHTKYTLRL